VPAKARKAKAMPATYKGRSTELGGGGRFQMVADQARASGAKNPEAVAAKVGREKYGAKKMAEMAAAGRKRAAAKRAARKR
jgi:hypothetical protein